MKLVALLVLAASVAFAQRPDPAITPGAIRTSNAAEICVPSFRTKPFRKTTAQMKHQVCRAYGVKNCPHQDTMEIDHLIPLELGGLDDVRNLWPQLASYPDGSPGFHVKDALENELRKQVCDGRMELVNAQECIAHDWIACYQAVIGPTPAK